MSKLSIQYVHVLNIAYKHLLVTVCWQEYFLCVLYTIKAVVFLDRKEKKGEKHFHIVTVELIKIEN